VSRTLAEKSLGCGDSWTMMDWVDPKLCEKLMSRVPDWKNGWPLFPTGAALALCAKHVKVCDEHAVPNGYSTEGWERLQTVDEGKAPAAPKASPKAAPKAAPKEEPKAAPKAAPTKSKKTAPAPASKSLEDLAAAETPSDAPVEPTEPTLEDLGDFPEAPAAEQTAVPEEDATEESLAPEEPAAESTEDDDFDPWGAEEG
jgi:hypothetical protein